MPNVITLDEVRRKRAKHQSPQVSPKPAEPNAGGELAYPYMALLIDHFESILESLRNADDSNALARLVEYRRLLNLCSQEVQQLESSAKFIEQIIESERPLGSNTF